MTETPTQPSRADDLAIDLVRAELAFDDLEGSGFECRLSGASGAFRVAVPVALGVLALVAGLTASAPIGLAIFALAVVLIPFDGARLLGLRVQGGTLQVLGPEVVVPLHQIRRVDLTITGLTLLIEDHPPIELQLTQTLGARAWLGERIRESIVQHGDFDDVPRALARLRGEEDYDA